MWTTMKYSIGMTMIHMEATKQQSTEHIIMNQSRQQAQFDDSCCPLGCCVSSQEADVTFKVQYQKWLRVRVVIVDLR